MEDTENELRLVRYSRKQGTGRARRPLVMPLTASAAIAQVLAQQRARASRGERAKLLSSAKGPENPRSEAPSSANGVVCAPTPRHEVQQEHHPSAVQDQEPATSGGIYEHITDGRSGCAVVRDSERPTGRRARPRLFALAIRLPPRPKRPSSLPPVQPLIEVATPTATGAAAPPSVNAAPALLTEEAAETPIEAAAPTQPEAAAAAPSAGPSSAPEDGTAAPAATTQDGGVAESTELPLSLTELIRLRLAAFRAAAEQHRAAEQSAAPTIADTTLAGAATAGAATAGAATAGAATAGAAGSRPPEAAGPASVATPAPSRAGPLSLSGQPRFTPARPHFTPIEGVPELFRLHTSPAPIRGCQGALSAEAAGPRSSGEASSTPIEGVPERLVKRRRISRPWEGLWMTPVGSKQQGNLPPTGRAAPPSVGPERQADPLAGVAEHRPLCTPAVALGAASCNAGEERGATGAADSRDAPAGDQPMPTPHPGGDGAAGDLTAGGLTTADDLVGDNAAPDGLKESDLASAALTVAEIAEAAAAACAKARAAYQKLQGQGSASAAPGSTVSTPSVSCATPSGQTHGSTGSTPAAVKVHNLGLAVVAAVQQAAERMGGLPTVAGGSGPRSRLPPRPPSSGSRAAAAAPPAAAAAAPGSAGCIGSRARQEPVPQRPSPGASCAPDSMERLIHRAPSDALLFPSSRTPSPMYGFRWPVATDAPAQQRRDDGVGPVGVGMVTPAAAAGSASLRSNCTPAATAPTSAYTGTTGAGQHSSESVDGFPACSGKAGSTGPELSFGNPGHGTEGRADPCATTPGDAGAVNVHDGDVDAGTDDGGCSEDGGRSDNVCRSADGGCSGDGSPAVTGADCELGSPAGQGGGQDWEEDEQQDHDADDADDHGHAMEEDEDQAFGSDAVADEEDGDGESGEGESEGMGVAIPDEDQAHLSDPDGGAEDGDADEECDDDEQGSDAGGEPSEEGDEGHQGAAPVEHSLLPNEDDLQDTDDGEQAQQEVRALPDPEPSHIHNSKAAAAAAAVAAAAGSDTDSDVDDGPPADVATERERCDSEDDREGLARVEDGLLMQDEDMPDADAEEMAKQVRALPDEPRVAARCRSGKADPGPSTQPAAEGKGRAADAAAEQAAAGAGRRAKREGQRLATNRKSLAGVGLTIDEVGTRRSTRSRVRPLQYWRGEHKSYGRDHKTLPTVKAITMRTPDSKWPLPSGLAMKAKRKARTKQAAAAEEEDGTAAL